MLSPNSQEQQYYTSKILEYSEPFHQDKITFLLRSSKQFRSNIFSFFGLIEWEFWLKVYLWLLLMLLINIMVYIKFSPKYKFNMKTVIHFLVQTLSKKLIGGLIAF